MPVYTYTVRNLASTCEEYLEFKTAYDKHGRDEDVHSLLSIQKLARTGIFSDDNNLVTFQIVTTTTASSVFGSDEIMKQCSSINKDISFDKLFSPTIIVASSVETKRILSLLEPISDQLQFVAVVFLTDKNFVLSKEISSKSILCVSAPPDSLFSKLDATVLEKLVFQLALSMTKSLQIFCRKCSGKFVPLIS